MNDAKESWQQADAFVHRFEEAWQKGRPAIADFLPDGPDRLAVLKELVEVDRERRLQAGESVPAEDYLQRFPELTADPRSITGEATVDETPRQHTVSAEATATPQYIGRYLLEKTLGQGGFGVVYLAYDTELKRRVAVKVPKAQRITNPEDAEAYLVEAQILAKLDHPHIVPVYDVGRSEDGYPFVVSKFIEGCSLADRIKQSRLAVREAVVLIARMAEALQYAHQHRLVHRDVKPGNILIDTSNKPFLVDFGLALKEEDFGKGGGILGTPAYMSPEQANGEGHLVDGRSDIFSLGVVLYELLTGRRPFTGASTLDVLTQISTVEARPLRHLAPAMPKELERITLKALAKKASERYSTALDFADDLQHWLEPKATAEQGPASLKIIPKGLRSFDAEDSDFFLELLPGPRDRDGLPDTLRFWKNRIEETEGDKTFRVGVIYGPSGCGKSSFVKAGLLPRLANSVRAIYVEATPDDTETRLLSGIQKASPDLPNNVSLPEAVAHLRRQEQTRQKMVLILDQFEQWLHGDQNQENAELVQALRQCDGERVRAIVMVRDDFWLAVSRFMKNLEIRIAEGHNAALVDLFDLPHARKVLTAYGRAYGTLPENDAPTKEQEVFLDQAVSGLAQQGKVISVRLALFAEMVKGKPWTPTTMKEVGGTEGVGITFLEETFSATTAPPEHRYHQKAARAVLKALLPEAGIDIKGHMRSHGELLEASGYASRPKDFDDLIHILDSEIRLITPTDPEGKEDATPSQVGAKYYQLTHDYLVHSLREWLTRKQKETRRGRAEIRLAERTAAWNAKPENRHLPAWWEWANICLFANKRNWTPPQQKMMRQATRYHAIRGFAVAACLILLGVLGWEGFGRLKAQTLRDRLLEATTSDVPAIVKDTASYRRWLDPLLHESYAQAEKDNDRRKQLHASLALLPVDSGQVDYLYGRLLQAEPEELVVIRAVLQRRKQDLTERLWRLLENPKNDQDQRHRAACALATFAPDDPLWEKVSDYVAGTLVIQKPFVIAQWTKALKDAGKWLISTLADFLVDEKRSVSERALIATVYGTYAADLPDAYARLEKQLEEKPEPDASADAKIGLAKRQASVGVALLVMARIEKVWQLLQHRPDPTLRSYLIDRLAQGGVDAKMLTARLDEEQEVSARRAILLSLGGFGVDRMSQTERRNLLPRLLQMYADDPDPGIHGAAEWLMRQWQMGEELGKINKGLATGKIESKRQWYINRQGQTMIVIPMAGEFWMGEEKQRHRQQIGHSFAIASKEVTVEEFLSFRKDHQFFKQFAPTGDCPINGVTWYEAAAYCNWLSEQEGIPKEQWCYVPNKAGKYEAGMKMTVDYLLRTGYRLPTEAEWEYACRAGAETAYSFGEPEELLSKYAWYRANSPNGTQPVGKLRPNDQGLFDMQGNVWEWCQDAIEAYNKRGDEKNTDISNLTGRVLRGGYFLNPASGVRSAYRNINVPTRNNFNGFRPARTLPPGSFTALPPPSMEVEK